MKEIQLLHKFFGAFLHYLCLKKNNSFGLLDVNIFKNSALWEQLNTIPPRI